MTESQTTSPPQPREIARIDWPSLAVWVAPSTAWLGVWLWVAGSVAAHRWAAPTEGPLEQLGWLTSIVATLILTGYLQLSLGVWPSSPTKALAQVLAPGLVGLFLLVLWSLSDWQIALAAALIWVTCDLQRQWLAPADAPADPAVVAGSRPPAKDDVRSQEETRGSADAPLDARSATHPAAAAGDASVTGDTSPTGNSSAAVPKEAADEVDEEVDEKADEFADEEHAGEGAGDWLQQMTRTNIPPAEVGRDGDWRPDPQRESVASGLTPSSRSWEKIEWFYRYRWNAGESQVDLHILFQPAFSQRPQTRVDVVEGVGKVTISDLQPHGVRLQLKRTYPPAAEAEVTSVIWLEAIGSSS